MHAHMLIDCIGIQITIASCAKLFISLSTYLSMHLSIYLFIIYISTCKSKLVTYNLGHSEVKWAICIVKTVICLNILYGYWGCRCIIKLTQLKQGLLACSKQKRKIGTNYEQKINKIDKGKAQFIKV